MHDTGCMCVTQRTGHVAENVETFRDWKASLCLEPRSQRFAVDERHREVRQAVGFASGQERNDVRLLQPRGELDLALEAIRVYASGKLRRKHLHDHPAVQAILGCEKNARHSAAAKLFLYGISCTEGRLELFEHGL